MTRVVCGNVRLDLEPSREGLNGVTRYRLLRDGTLVGAAWTANGTWWPTLRAHPDRQGGASA